VRTDDRVTGGDRGGRDREARPDARPSVQRLERDRRPGDRRYRALGPGRPARRRHLSGRGGWLACGIAVKAFSPRTRVLGAEPANADDASRTLESGKIERCDDPRTIADGLRTTSIGERNFAAIAGRVDHIFRVTEAEIIDAMRYVWERLKIVIEPSSAVAIAPILTGKLDASAERVGVIVSGGNVDFETYFRDLAARTA
jgi:threonine dehydratase